MAKESEEEAGENEGKQSSITHFSLTGQIDDVVLLNEMTAVALDACGKLYLQLLRPALLSAIE
jgi:hypothetical protein